MKLDHDVDRQGPAVDRARLELEAEIRRAEISIQRERLEIEKKSIGRVSPLAASILVAVVGLLGTALGASISGCAEIRLARQEFEAGLIVKAIEAESREQAEANLAFFLETGLLQEYREGLRILADETRPRPRIGTASIGDLGVSIDTEKQSYRLGEIYQIDVEVAEPSYIWLFALTTGREVTWLGETDLPKKQLSATVRAVEPVGSEMFVAFASRKQIATPGYRDAFDHLSAAGAGRVAQAVRLVEVVE